MSYGMRLANQCTLKSLVVPIVLGRLDSTLK